MWRYTRIGIVIIYQGVTCSRTILNLGKKGHYMHYFSIPGHLLSFQHYVRAEQLPRPEIGDVRVLQHYKIKIRNLGGSHTVEKCKD